MCCPDFKPTKAMFDLFTNEMYETDVEGGGRRRHAAEAESGEEDDEEVQILPWNEDEAYFEI